MKRIWIFFVIILNSLTSLSQQSSFEQEAFNYYCQKIHPAEVKNKIKYFLKNSITNQKSTFLYGVCFDDYKKTKNVQTVEILPSNRIELLSNCQMKLLGSKRVKGKTIVFLNQATASPINTVFVEIIVRNQDIGNHYYVELTPQKEPIRWCKTTVIF